MNSQTDIINVNSDDSNDRDSGICCELLYHRRELRKGAEAPVGRHRHPFWHIDLMAEGTVTLETSERRWRIDAGRGLLIRPGVDHRFFYSESPSDLLTIRACVTGAPELRHPVLFDLGKLNGAIARILLESLSTNELPDRQSRDVLEHLLAAYLAASIEPGSASDDDAWDERIARFVRTRVGQPVSISDVAGMLGYSESHVRAVFRKKYGTSLKKYLDSERSAEARRQLVWRDVSIKEVSYDMGFPDAYSFSRFFRRVNGCSPSAFRKQYARRSAPDGNSPSLDVRKVCHVGEECF